MDDDDDEQLIEELQAREANAWDEVVRRRDEFLAQVENYVSTVDCIELDSVLFPDPKLDAYEAVIGLLEKTLEHVKQQQADAESELENSIKAEELLTKIDGG